MTKLVKMRFSGEELEALRASFSSQLLTVAALLACEQDKMMDFSEAASDAVDLFDALMDVLEAEEV